MKTTGPIVLGFLTLGPVLFSQDTYHEAWFPETSNSLRSVNTAIPITVTNNTGAPAWYQFDWSQRAAPSWPGGNSNGVWFSGATTQSPQINNGSAWNFTSTRGIVVNGSYSPAGAFETWLVLDWTLSRRSSSSSDIWSVLRSGSAVVRVFGNRNTGGSYVAPTVTGSFPTLSFGDSSGAFVRVGFVGVVTEGTGAVSVLGSSGAVLASTRVSNGVATMAFSARSGDVLTLSGMTLSSGSETFVAGSAGPWTVNGIIETGGGEPDTGEAVELVSTLSGNVFAITAAILLAVALEPLFNHGRTNLRAS